MTRKTISLLTLFSFLTLAASSFVLYLVPGGRETAAVPVLGLTKLTWKNIHITGGFLFLIAAGWHTLLNQRPLVSYLKKSAGITRQALTPLLAAIAITGFVYAGTIMDTAPMRAVLTWNKPAHDASAMRVARAENIATAVPASAANTGDAPPR